MPEIRYYLVTQERQVRVSATNSTDAMVLANRVFSDTKKPEDQIDIQEEPRETSLNIREEA